jgi:hypothetical protein
VKVQVLLLLLLLLWVLKQCQSCRSCLQLQARCGLEHLQPHTALNQLLQQQQQHSAKMCCHHLLLQCFAVLHCCKPAHLVSLLLQQ